MPPRKPLCKPSMLFAGRAHPRSRAEARRLDSLPPRSYHGFVERRRQHRQMDIELAALQRAGCTGPLTELALADGVPREPVRRSTTGAPSPVAAAIHAATAVAAAAVAVSAAGGLPVVAAEPGELASPTAVNTEQCAFTRISAVSVCAATNNGDAKLQSFQAFFQDGGWQNDTEPAVAAAPAQPTLTLKDEGGSFAEFFHADGWHGALLPALHSRACVVCACRHAPTEVLTRGPVCRRPRACRSTQATRS